MQNKNDNGSKARKVHAICKLFRMNAYKKSDFVYKSNLNHTKNMYNMLTP